MVAGPVGLSVAVLLALAYQDSMGPEFQSHEMSFDNLSKLASEGTLRPKAVQSTGLGQLVQWFNFNQWNNCISGMWRNC